MLALSLRRRPNIEPTLGQRLLFAGTWHIANVMPVDQRIVCFSSLARWTH